MKRNTEAIWGVPRLSIFGVRLAVLLLAVYWLLIFTGTHIPRPPSTGIENADKAQHFIAFLGLAFLLAWAIPASKKNVGVKMTVGFLVAACYGVFDELTQSLVGRSTDLYDYYADVAGALTGVVVYYLARRFWVGRRSPDGGHRQESERAYSREIRDEQRNAA